MGLYGSPDLSQKKAKPVKRVKGEGNKPQTNIWVWAVIIILDIFILLLAGFSRNDFLAIVSFNWVIIFSISIVNLTYNLIKSNKIKKDILFMVLSIIIFIVSGILMN